MASSNIINPITSSLSIFYEKTKSNYSRDIGSFNTFNKNGLWIKKFTDKQDYSIDQKI